MGGQGRQRSAPGIWSFLRRDNAGALSRRDHGVAVWGALDHGVEEATYLQDPEGDGLERCRDRPPPAWPWHDGRLATETRPITWNTILTEWDTILTELEGDRRDGAAPPGGGAKPVRR